MYCCWHSVYLRENIDFSKSWSRLAAYRIQRHYKDRTHIYTATKWPTRQTQKYSRDIFFASSSFIRCLFRCCFSPFLFRWILVFRYEIGKRNSIKFVCMPQYVANIIPDFHPSFDGCSFFFHKELWSHWNAFQHKSKNDMIYPFMYENVNSVECEIFRRPQTHPS